MYSLYQQKFGNLLTICPTEKRTKGKEVIWLCRCICGNLTEVASAHLISGHTKSCGCLRKEFSLKHGDAINKKRHRIYRIWIHMKQRCENKNSYDYKYYGRKGISVCEEWRNNYPAFKLWALLNGYDDNLTIDRIDHNGNYEPSNCQWLTQSKNVIKANKDRIRRLKC